MDPLDDIVKEFLIESLENIDRLDQDLLALEEVPDDRARLSSVFRAIHTIKGTSGFLAFGKLEHITHVGESLLVLLRDGKLRLNSTIASGLLSLVDAVRKVLANIESGIGEGNENYDELVATLERLQVTGGVDQVTVGHENSSEELSPEDARRASEVLESIAQQVDSIAENEALQAVESDVAVPAKRRRTGSNRRKKANSNAAGSSAAAVAELDPTSTRILETIMQNVIKPELSERSNVAPKPVEVKAGNVVVPKVANSDSALKQETPGDSDACEKGQPQSVSDSTVRIEVTLLDKLMNLVGELVLTRNQILQYSRTTEDASLIAASQRLNLITTELQEGVMKTRMQPIQNAWSKLPRVVRDLSMMCGKNVQLKMEGAETELDKTILEAIRDPLTHIVRNSVDHGIESPEVRKANGKPAEGTLRLRAFHESGQVHIEISDDGGGINLTRVKEKALSQGLINAEQATSMSERELMNLILLPGFSTASTVTNISGRGVGMDVVKTNVEKIGGTLDIHSQFGQGTTLRIKIPLTLAIVPALMVSTGNDRYAIPQKNLVELVRLEGERVQREIEHIHDVPVYRLRGELLPLLFLDEQLQLRPRRTVTELGHDSVVNIVVLNADERQFGLVVDDINDTEEIVVKPLGPHLKGISSYAGVTIMGDGTVALILDALGIAKQSKVISETNEGSKARAEEKENAKDSATQTLLLLGLGDEQRLAIPLSLVARLEEIPFSSIELANGQQVVQYGGQVMPLINLGDALRRNQARNDAKQVVQVVVYSENGRNVGLVVDQILDIVETTLTVHRSVKQVGVLGSAIIQNRVTDLLDVHNLILATDQDFFAPPPTALAV